MATNNLAPASDTAYDPKPWGPHIHSNIDVNNIAKNKWHDGLHQINASPNSTIDVYTKNIKKCSTSRSNKFKCILVGLSGAIANRNGKKAPFFSGISIADDLNLPIIAISDPTLSLDANIPLAWYAGNIYSPNLPVHIAAILDSIATFAGSELILFGGSGGGFAALKLSSLIQSPTSTLIWNPQTAIADYAPSFIKTYLDVAFPAFAKECQEALEAPRARQSEAFQKILVKSGISHDVRNLLIQENVRVIYLQNKTDWHVERHAQPFMALRKWRKYGSSGHICTSGESINIHFTNWGEGHAAPPKELVKELIHSLAMGASITEFMKLVESLAPSDSTSISKESNLGSTSKLESNLEISVKATRNGDRIYTKCDGGLGTLPLSYAFYLLDGGQRCAMRWYESSSEAKFDVPENASRLEVVAFCRDVKGQQSSVRILVQPGLEDEVKAAS